MNYCSHCGSDQLQHRIPDGDNLPRFVCSQCGRIHYQNPKMVVGCLIYNDAGEVMLARRSIEPRYGYWNLPCGFLELGETVEQGALREVQEETGATVALGPLHTIYNLPHAHQVYLIFLAQMRGQYAQETPESLEVAFFKEADIPWPAVAFSSNVFALRHFFQSRRSPELSIPAVGGLLPSQKTS